MEGIAAAFRQVLGYQNSYDGSGRLRSSRDEEDWGSPVTPQTHRSYISSRRWHRLKSRLYNIPWRYVKRWGYVKLDDDEEGSTSKSSVKGEVPISYLIYSLIVTLWRRRRSSLLMRTILHPITFLVLIGFAVVSFASRESGGLGKGGFDVFDYIDPLIGTTNGGLFSNFSL